MVKRVLIIILIINLIGIINSCCTWNINYKWINVSSLIIDNSDISPKICILDSINKKAYGIRVVLKDTIMKYSYIPQIYNSAYGSCGCGEKYTGHNYIVSLTVRTLYDFDDMKLKNSNVSDYFVARLSDDTSSDYTAINDGVNKFNDGAKSDQHIAAFDLYLMKQPSKFDTCQFSIELELSDNTSISTITRKVKLF